MMQPYLDLSTQGLLSEKAPKGFHRILLRGAACCLSVMLWAASSSGQTAASLGRAYREKPSAVKRSALLRFAQQHIKDRNGALALLAASIVEADSADYPDAIRHLSMAKSRLPLIDDYVAYYTGLSHFGMKDFDSAASELEKIWNHSPTSPLMAKAILLAVQCHLQAGRHLQAIKILTGFYDRLPQPDGTLALAKSYEAAGNLNLATDYYQRVYYQFPEKAQAEEAASALERMKRQLGAAYPPPMPQTMLARAEKLLEAKNPSRARSEFESLISQLGGAEQELAKVGVGAALLAESANSRGCQYLESLRLESEEASAERLYYLIVCYRRLGVEEKMMELLQRLSRDYPQSPWRLKALVWVANHHLLANNPALHEPLYRACFDSFSSDPMAEYCHWKVTWTAYLQRRPEARALLLEHLQRFPGGEKTDAALYFLGRLAEKVGETADAEANYRTILQLYPNHFYGLQAALKLQGPRMSKAPSTSIRLPLELPRSTPRVSLRDFEPNSATRTRMERFRLLASAGLDDLAENELKFGAKEDGQPPLLAMELARSAARRGSYDQSIRYVKALVPDYISIPFSFAPPEFWRLAFPLPYRALIVRYSRANKLDPFLLAGLVRQESEFNPRVVSPARAYGLTQILPSTGKLLARKLKLRFRDGMLLRADFNLRLGAFYLRSLIDEFDGKLEPALASYNGGKNRVVQWLSWMQYEEPAEFVETIPITETRGYVQAVMRNAAIYRRLYAAQPAKVISSHRPLPKSNVRKRRRVHR